MPTNKKDSKKEDHRPLGLYLLHLVMYPGALDAHLADPSKTMKTFNLSPDVRKLMLGEPSLADIAKQVEAEFGKRPGDFLMP
jgi:hypothetical protein